jgi:glycosyltransferase involved in cell wall biosynthesis
MGRSLRGRFSGIVRYTHELTRALSARLPGQLTVFVTRAADDLDGLALERVRAPFPTPNEYARAIWEQLIVPLQVRRLHPDVYHSPNYILPLTLRCPTVVTIHDLAFLDRSVHRLRSHLYLSVLAGHAIRRANRVICVSNFTRDRLVARFPSARDRVRVVSEGVGPGFRPAALADVEAFRDRHRLDAPYVLFVGTLEPRKNLPRLIGAFARAVREGGFPHLLVVAGAGGWKEGPVWQAHRESPLRDRIRFVGYLDEAELPAAYSGADVFAYPSLEEGFGLPALEAMACGTPVLTSDGSSLPEVVGDAAVQADPRDESALAAALAGLLGDPRRREALSAAGRRRARRFAWDAVAEQTLAVYREAAG